MSLMVIYGFVLYQKLVMEYKGLSSYSFSKCVVRFPARPTWSSHLTLSLPCLLGRKTLTDFCEHEIGLICSTHRNYELMQNVLATLKKIYCTLSVLQNEFQPMHRLRYELVFLLTKSACECFKPVVPIVPSPIQRVLANHLVIFFLRVDSTV